MTDATNDNSDSGVEVDLISGDRLEGMPTMEKVKLILDRVQEDKVVILEQGLTPDEESKLVEVTMSEISPEGFSGIEIERPLDKQDTNDGFRKRLGRIVGGEQEDESTIVLIGPADTLETIQKGNDIVSTMIRRSERHTN